MGWSAVHRTKLRHRLTRSVAGMRYTQMDARATPSSPLAVAVYRLKVVVARGEVVMVRDTCWHSRKGPRPRRAQYVFGRVLSADVVASSQNQFPSVHDHVHIRQLRGECGKCARWTPWGVLKIMRCDNNTTSPVSCAHRPALQ